ncbi:MAG: right-handed parallel beta-helix repeat-containing protein, partial [Sphingomonadaceae bacterium]|nr:right-handed parallel beta-helix repeat-containing protein [Sphingomonadaceae bacterium]
MAILTVGASQHYSSLSRAVAAAGDGDTIRVQAGTYTNDFTTIAKDLTIEGVGGMAKFVATVAPPNGKAIMVTSADVTIRNLEFSGAKVSSANGAGIRYESGDLVVENSYFHHNQMGLLSNGDPDGTIVIRNSEFAFNGGGTGYTHGLYVNHIQSLTVEDSDFHDANNGHHVKSRAANTILIDNRIVDGSNGISSYNIDLPNGGNALLQGNVIQQNAKSPNIAIVSFGAEGKLIAGTALEMIDNVVIDDHASANVRLLVNRTTVAAKLIDTDVWGLTAAQLATGPATITGTDFLAARPAIDSSSPWTTAPTPTPTPTP